MEMVCQLRFWGVMVGSLRNKRHSNALSWAFRERDYVSLKGRGAFWAWPRPAPGFELVGAREDGFVVVHQKRSHAHRCLFGVKVS